MCSLLNSPFLADPDMVPRVDAAARDSSLAYSAEEGPPHVGEQDSLAPPSRLVSCMAPQRVSRDLPETVLNTIAEARTPSTRRLHALKWSVFTGWCSAQNLDPYSCEVPLVLSFLQQLLDAGRTPSTLKVYPAATAAFHAPVAGQSLGKSNLIVRFLKGARRLNQFIFLQFI